MELSEQLRIRASRGVVFAALNDPQILRQSIPGCESFEATSPVDFKATITAKVGPLAARFNGAVRLSEIVELQSYTLTGEGKAGPAGFARVTARVQLADDGGDTLMSYTVKADIGGKLGQLGGGMIERTSKKLAGEFFQKFETLVAPGTQPEVIALQASAAPPARPQRGPLYVGLAVAAVALLAVGYYLLK